MDAQTKEQGRGLCHNVYLIYNSKIHMVTYDVLFQIEIWNKLTNRG